MSDFFPKQTLGRIYIRTRSIYCVVLLPDTYLLKEEKKFNLFCLLCTALVDKKNSIYFCYLKFQVWCGKINRNFALQNPSSKDHSKKFPIPNHHHKKIRQISLTENDYAGTPKPILIVHSNKLPPVVTRQIVAPGNMTPHE